MKDTLPSTLGRIALEETFKDRLGRLYAVQIIGAAGVSSIILQQGQTLRIGRRRDSEIVVEHPGASRDHAIIHEGDPPQIEDLESNNGTRVQGNPIATVRAHPLPVGSVVEIAGTILHVRHLVGRTTEAQADVKTWSLRPAPIANRPSSCRTAG